MENTVSVEVVLNQISNSQQTIQADMSAVRENVGRALTHLEVIDSRNKVADDMHRDFETRIRLLERFRFTMAGISVVGGMASGFVGYLIGHAIH